jgi:hypothetical protein
MRQENETCGWPIPEGFDAFPPSSMVRLRLKVVSDPGAKKFATERLPASALLEISRNILQQATRSNWGARQEPHHTNPILHKYPNPTSLQVPRQIDLT